MIGGRGVLGREEGAPAIVGHVVAAGDVGILEQAAGAHREGRVDDLVDVERDALGPVGAELGIHALEVDVAGLLGDDVDRAAGGAAAGIGRCRAAQDLDLLGEEVLADRHRGIADAVDEDVVARVETADEEAVAERVAALARAQRHAGGRAPDLLQRRGVLVLEHFLAEHRDGLRRVQHRLGKLARGLDVVDLVGRGRIGIGIAVDFADRCGRSSLLGRLLPLRGTAKRVAGADLIRRRLRGHRTRTLRREHRPSPAAGSTAALLRRSTPTPPRSGSRPPTPPCRNSRRISLQVNFLPATERNDRGATTSPIPTHPISNSSIATCATNDEPVLSIAKNQVNAAWPARSLESIQFISIPNFRI